MTSVEATSISGIPDRTYADSLGSSAGSRTAYADNHYLAEVESPL